MIKILNVKSLYSALYQTVEYCKENENKEIEIIVPDKLSLFMEKFLFEKMNIGASFNIKVSTLNRFAKKPLNVDKEKQISKVGSIILIHRILNEHLNDLRVLKSKAYSFSYAEDVFKTISQLKASKIGVEEMKKFNSADEQLKGKIQDLALVYEEYENQKAGLLDASDLFLMSALFVEKGKDGANILFVGFDDFTAIEYQIIENLAVVANVNIINYNSNADNKYIYNNEIISQLKTIAYVKELPFEIVSCKEQSVGVKNFLEKNLYSLKNSKFELNKELIKVFAGNKIEEEIEFVARDIRNKVLKGQKFSNFGVCVFGLENCENKVKEIFEKYELNFYVDSEIMVSKSVLFKFFVSVFKYNLDGYGLSHLLDIINSPFFDLEKNKKREIIQSLMAVNFRGKISYNTNLNIDDETKNELVEFIERVVFEKDVEAQELVDILKNIDIDFDKVLDVLAQHNLENKIILKKSKDIIFTLFDEILRFNPTINVREFFDVFNHVANVVKINNLPLKLDCVKVVDANNTMEIFDEIYIVGTTHENAPNLKYDCGIILDGEIEQLNFKHKLSPTIAHINQLARLRLFNLIMLFENELNITYSNSQSDVIKDLLDRLQIETKAGLIDLKPISTFGYEKYVALSKWDYIEYLCKNNNEKILKNYLNEEKIIKNKEIINISKENLNIFEDFKIISATTLENYFKCPFYAFLSNILKIKPNLKTEILSLDIGNVLHGIMDKYYKKEKNVGDIYEFCKTEVFNCVEKEERLKLNVDSPILTNLIDEAVRVINAVNYIDANSNFQTNKGLVEFSFAGDKALKLKNISIIGKVDRVDICNDMFRIIDYKSGKADASLKELYYGNKLQLFLYSCAMENVLKKKAVGTFYLPLHNAYTKELTNTYSLKGFYLAEDFVVHAFDKRLVPGMKSDIVNVVLTKNNSVRKTIGYKELESAQLDSLKNYAKTVSENAVEEIKSGYIEPTPSAVSKPCEYCPYSHLCLKECNNIEYRQVNKVNLDSFKEEQDEGV